MDTKTAIEILSTASQDLSVSIDRDTREKTAIDLAVSQLQGLLDTPSQDLKEAKDVITKLQQDITDASQRIDSLTLENATLKTPTTVDVVTESL